MRYAQPADGFRTGIEPVLLAASVPAVAGDRVLEAGVGAGAGLLCLAARVPGVLGTGVEIDPVIAELARRNVADNGYARIEIVTGAIEAAGAGQFDHAMANPPWHDPHSTASPLPRRRRAKQEGAARTLEAWIAALARHLTKAGSLTLILPASLEDRASTAMAAEGLGGGVRCHLLAKAERPAKLLLLQAWRCQSGPRRTDSRVLHGGDGAFTDPIQAVLRSGEALDLSAKAA